MHVATSVNYGQLELTQLTLRYSTVGHFPLIGPGALYALVPRPRTFGPAAQPAKTNQPITSALQARLIHPLTKGRKQNARRP